MADMANGDARAALNAVELGILTTERSGDGKIHITLGVAAECIQKRTVAYDKDGDNHYDLLSALQKSIRGSDPDAACHYLARLLEVGQMQSACRRLMVIAAEDVGLAYPMIIPIVKSCVDMALMHHLVVIHLRMRLRMLHAPMRALCLATSMRTTSRFATQVVVSLATQVRVCHGR